MVAVDAIEFSARRRIRARVFRMPGSILQFRRKCRLIHLSHAACSEVTGDYVVGEFCSDHDVMKISGGFYQTLRIT
jgi:hypothetical protein